MQMFHCRARVHYFDTFAEFAKEFALSDTDLILTEKIMFSSFVEKLNLPCHIILKDEYDPGEPKEEVVDAIALAMKDLTVKRIVAIGGGSVIDIAKILLNKNVYPCRRLIEGEVPVECDKELITLPSTCGTGSEVTYGGIYTMKENGLKTALMSDRMTSSHAVLVPELIENLPFRIFVHCSVDALAHAMESYVSATRGNDFARAMGAQAIKLILNGYADILQNGENYRKKICKQFISASCMAGLAVNNGGAGPAHALAYPLGEVYHMSHGESVYQFLGTVMSIYLRENPQGEIIQELAEIVRKPVERAGFQVSDTNVFDQMEAMLDKVYPMRKLHEAGMKEEEIETFCDSLIESKQRLLAASYVPFTKELMIEAYRRRF